MRESPETLRAAIAALTPPVREIAREIGVSYASLHAWTTGRRRPRVEHVERITVVMDRRAAELWELACRLRQELREDPGT